jgi:hypothetical protein
LVFQGTADGTGNLIYVVLPSQNTFEDSDAFGNHRRWYRLLTKAVNLLAAIEDKSPQEIINLLTQTPASSTAGT